MRKIIFCSAIVLITFFLSCQKRPFAEMGVRGHLVTSRSGLRVDKADIILLVGSSGPASEEGQVYGNDKSDENGDFEITSHAQWNGNNYQLSILFGDSTGGTHQKFIWFDAEKNEKVDLGAINLEF